MGTGALRLLGRSGHVLPLGLEVAGRRVEWASAEVTRHSPDRLDLGPGLDREGGTTVLLAAGTPVAEDPSYVVDEGPGGSVRVSGGPGPLSLRFG